MKKLVVLALAIVLVSSLILAACATPAPAPSPAPTPTPAPGPTPEKPLELKFSYHAPPEASLTKAIFAPWAAEIEKATGGRVKITQYPGGTLVKAQDAYDAVATGLCDLAQIDPEENPGRFPLTGINSLPFMYPNTEVAGVVSYELLNKYVVNTELKEIKFLITAPLHNAQYLGKKPVEKLADFKGLKIRSGGKVEASTITALGGTPVEIGTGDLFSALDKGTVDGCFFTYSGALAFGLKDATKYRTECNIFPRVFIIGMNKATFDKMPADIQKIFNENSTLEVAQKYAAAHMAAEAGGKGAIIGSDKKAGNPPIYVLPSTERDAWKTACMKVWNDWVADVEAKKLPGKAMLDEAQSLVNKYSQSK